MKYTPIIMSGNHPRLIIDLQKTMTRRVIKADIPNDVSLYLSDGYLSAIHPKNFQGWFFVADKKGRKIKCPYGQVGDRLWVRETWAVSRLYNNLPPRLIDKDATVYYFADGEEKPYWIGRTRASIHLPKWASGITLEITEVRVERLQEITEEDAKAEGIVPFYTLPGGKSTLAYAFQLLWDSLNAKRGFGWEVNPFVWVISFRRTE